jgi:DNA-directed RNA polymerase specialized sigma24 family protein
MDRGDLLLRYYGGDGEAFAVFYTKSVPFLFTVIRECGGPPFPHEAWDVVQEVLMRVARSKGTKGAWNGERAVEAWLKTIPRNVIVDKVRQRPAQEVPHAEMPEPRRGGWFSGGRQSDDVPMEVARLREALERLPAELKDVIEMKNLGMSNVEVGWIKGWLPAKADRKVRVAREKLLELLND